MRDSLFVHVMRNGCPCEPRVFQLCPDAREFNHDRFCPLCLGSGLVAHYDDGLEDIVIHNRMPNSFNTSEGMGR